MRDFETVHAEPRNVLRSPKYRVNFWQGSHIGSWNLDGHILVDAQDLTEVLGWVEENAHGRQFELFVELDDEPNESFQHPRRSKLVRLIGDDPNAA
ncbi:hypothetical protein GC088_12630 [Arthrobacter sp. JZ12]|uniref:hypothetical protein n=1 Tax=Arthrobacter sp. JZ12 TaxID=2654190 RepID=UPI002B4A42B4|nr:hypothetical protein [Arthrobacter sp. JZ12]WRH25832.1 hypothetical protein GC088_12630 [Arthrobacter sp. JZ12]